jgi:cytochrome c biogenesis protein CcdA
MFFKLYPNSFNQVSKGFTKGLFVIGLLLIGFGTLVWVLKEVLAVIAAAIFIAAGFLCCFSSVRFFLASRKMRPFQDDSNGRSGNVKIRIEQDLDI